MTTSLPLAGVRWTLPEKFFSFSVPCEGSGTVRFTVSVSFCAAASAGLHRARIAAATTTGCPNLVRRMAQLLGAKGRKSGGGGGGGRRGRRVPQGREALPGGAAGQGGSG